MYKSAKKEQSSVENNYEANQNAYSSLKINCASEKKKTIFNSVLIGIGVVAVIAIVGLIVIMKAPSVNKVDNSTNISNTVLSNDYTSENGSFSLKYPSDWNIIPNTAVFVELSSPDGMANLQVIECLFDAYGVFTDSEAEIKNSVNQFHTFLDFWDTKLDNVSIKALSYQTNGLKGKRTVNNYWYEIGDKLYQIICSYEKAEYEAVLENILNSYTINNTAFSASHESNVQNDASNIIPESIKVGDYFTFGTYEQDNNKNNGAEDIEWLVLDKNDDEIFVVSKYALDCKPFCTFGEISTTWDNSTLRQWLNGEFFKTAFNSEEQNAISTSWVIADDNPYSNIDPGDDTEDKVFFNSPVHYCHEH